ncbi:YybH family protein [Pseudorhodoferax sp.]|uniref:YybH family protein n=1 Tax=Pseudorhodoferax sp. TaxID=1993553 RepID=UPI002DD62A3A|nr:nuclear transport factor 2 family protein [Pseudorhodoferax sp.]
MEAEISLAAARAVLAGAEAAWNAAGTPWDATALARVYAPDALFFGGRPGHAVGRDAVHGYFASYEGVILSGRMQLVDMHIVPLSARAFLAQGAVAFGFVLAGGEHTQSTLRATLLLMDEGDGWRLRQHHFSAPPAAPPLRTEPTR